LGVGYKLDSVSETVYNPVLENKKKYLKAEASSTNVITVDLQSVLLYPKQMHLLCIINKNSSLITLQTIDSMKKMFMLHICMI